MTIEITVLVLSITSILFTLVTAIFSVLAYSKVIGMEKSTHQVAWMPVEEPDPSVLSGESNDEPEQPTESELMKSMIKHMYSEEEEQV